MRTLHAYLTRQVLATLLMTVAVFTFILLLGNGLREVLPLLVSRQAGLGVVAEAFALLIPFVLAYALPVGLLTATLLVFGRFSADQELTAARASGISLVALAGPVLALSLAFSGLCAFFNMQISPQCRVAYKALLSRLGMEQAIAFVAEGQFIKDFPGYVIYIGGKRGQTLEDIWICKLNAEDRVEGYYRAPRGELAQDPDGRQVTLTLYDYVSTSLLDGRWHPYQSDELVLPLAAKSTDGRRREPPLSDMTFGQLRAKRQELERLLENLPATGPARRSDLVALRKLRSDPTAAVEIQLHRQMAFSFASIGFTLVGIPLGIRAHRRETSAGVAMALVLLLLYYSFIILGQSLSGQPQWAPHLILWLPNFLFQAVGAVLLWRANRGI